MTMTLLACDPSTGTLCGIAATGNLCVGGWVLRAKPGVGIASSQGTLPNVYLGEMILNSRKGSPEETLAYWIDNDPGKDSAQYALIDISGKFAFRTGKDNEDAKGCVPFQNGLALGNMLSSNDVLKKMADTYELTSGNPAERLLSAAEAGAKAGGDYRGLKSSAMIVHTPNKPPLNLRIDYHPDPLQALRNLYEMTLDPAYSSWLDQLPTEHSFNESCKQLIHNS